MTALSSVLAAPGGCEPSRAQCGQTLHIITHPLGRLRILLLPSGNRSRAALKGKGLEKSSAGSFLFPVHLLCSSHDTSEDNLLDPSCLHLTVGVLPGTAGLTRANALMVRLGLAAVFDPRQWCQDDTKVVPTSPLTMVGGLSPKSLSLTQNKPRVFLSSLM